MNTKICLLIPAIGLTALLPLSCLAQPVTGSAVEAAAPSTQAGTTYNLELAEALKCKGDVEKGKIAYEVCRGCHKADASGRPDAGYPRLTGQHSTVLIKQMLDIRAGRRDNPKMHPFVEQEAVALENIPDVAAYLNSLPITTGNRKGDGKELGRGKALYDKDCASCHSDRGEGDAQEFIPRMTSQHYPYIYRATLDIRDMQRRNANARMTMVLQGYSDEDIAAVSDYVARLTEAP